MIDEISQQVMSMSTGLCPLYERRVVESPAKRPEARVLVVDDDPLTLEVLAIRLEDAGYRVTTAADGEQEVLQAETLRLGLIITDVHMPGVGGLEAYHRLRTSRLVSPLLPVILLTGLRLEAVREKLPADPLIRLLPKPIDFHQLMTAIRELTGLDRPLVAKEA